MTRAYASRLYTCDSTKILNLVSALKEEEEDKYCTSRVLYRVQ